MDAWDALDATTLHVTPTDDLIEHNTSASDACVCGPDVELMQSENGDKWLVRHHSLDGRELSEPAALHWKQQQREGGN